MIGEEAARDRAFAVTAIRERLVHGNHCPIRPLSTRLPFDYHRVPGEARVLVAKGMGRLLLRRLRVEKRSPSTYADNDTDLLIARLAAATAGATWMWPGGRATCLVISHDIDGPDQAAGIQMFRSAAEQRGLRATFSVVGAHVGRYDTELRDLRRAGHEIALHDVAHDNRIAFLDRARIIARLASARAFLHDHGIRGFRSPSWYTSLALWTALEEIGFAYDMSVLDTYSFFEPSRNYGVASAFPYRVGGLTILPNTIPLELAWLWGVPVEDTLTYWRPKFDWLARNGGLIMIGVHPDRWWTGGQRAFGAYTACLDYVLETHRPACLTAGEVQAHFAREGERGATMLLEGAPPLAVARLGPGTWTSGRRVEDPFERRAVDAPLGREDGP